MPPSPPDLPALPLAFQSVPPPRWVLWFWGGGVAVSLLLVWGWRAERGRLEVALAMTVLFAAFLAAGWRARLRGPRIALTLTREGVGVGSGAKARFFAWERLKSVSETCDGEGSDSIWLAFTPNGGAEATKPILVTVSVPIKTESGLRGSEKLIRRIWAERLPEGNCI